MYEHTRVSHLPMRRVQRLDDLNIHTEKSYRIKPKSDCIYHFPIDLDPNGHCPFAVLNQSENGKYNQISV